MANLNFKYSSMNAGKSTILIQTAFNYEERGLNIVLIKPLIDSKGDNKIVSRVGLSRNVDYLIDKDDSIIERIIGVLSDIDCILVDEAQFLNKEQVDELFYIAKIYDIAVIAYGLRTDFKLDAFIGSARLLELADKIEEIPTMCSCGKKARFNARIENGKYIKEGKQVEIDNQSNIKYESLCGKCFLEKVMLEKEW